MHAVALSNWVTHITAGSTKNVFSYLILVWRYRGTNKRKHSWLVQQFIWVAQLERASAHRAEDTGSNPGPNENFFLKLETIKLLHLDYRYHQNLWRNFIFKMVELNIWHGSNLRIAKIENLYALTIYISWNITWYFWVWK